MNEETQMLVEQLSNAINHNSDQLAQLGETVGRPDWAIIILTAVNVAFMIWLGVKQYHLQKQQNKLQREQNALQKQQNAIQCYEIYKNTQQIFASINFFARTLLPDILHYLRHEYKPNTTPHIIEEMKSQILSYSKELQDRTLDVNLHLSHWPIFEYEDLLTEMSALIKNLEGIIEQDGIDKSKVLHNPIVEEGEDYYAEAISLYIDDKYAENFKDNLYSYIYLRDDVLSYDASSILQHMYNTPDIDD